MGYNLLKKEMKGNPSKIGTICKTIVVLAFVLFGTHCRAQNWSWSDMANWFEHKGVEILAVYAHPVADVADYEIVSVSSSSIIVKIYFEGALSDYTSKYEIVKGTSNGMTYFKTVRVISDDVLGTSFVSWDSAPKFHSQLYQKILGSSLGNELYGSSSFDDLSLNKKAAFGLFMEFCSYYAD